MTSPASVETVRSFRDALASSAAGNADWQAAYATFHSDVVYAEDPMIDAVRECWAAYDDLLGRDVAIETLELCEARRTSTLSAPSGREPRTMAAVSDEVETVEDSERALSPARAEELIGGGADLIDVRRPVEFEAGHLYGARNVEMNQLTAHSAEIARDRPVVFYCRTGNRSGMAADAFREGGWDAHNLDGGIEEWVADGRPLDPPDGAVISPPPPSADAA